MDISYQLHVSISQLLRCSIQQGGDPDGELRATCITVHQDHRCSFPCDPIDRFINRVRYKFNIPMIYHFIKKLPRFSKVINLAQVVITFIKMIIHLSTVQKTNGNFATCTKIHIKTYETLSYVYPCHINISLKTKKKNKEKETKDKIKGDGGVFQQPTTTLAEVGESPTIHPPPS